VAAAVAGQGGPAARSARVLRRRLRVFGGSPAARRWLSSYRAVQACRMRWLRTISKVAVNSISDARPMRRHQRTYRCGSAIAADDGAVHSYAGFR
jgi:hypothetical protein